MLYKQNNFDIFINALPNLHFTARSFFEIIDQALDLLKRQTLTAPDLTYIINKGLIKKTISTRQNKTNQTKIIRIYIPNFNKT